MQAKATIMPIGGVVQHGPHLPLELDSLVAEYYAHQAATRLYPYIIVTPTLPVSVATFHMATVGTLTLEQDTLSNITFEIAASLSKYGQKKVLFYNGHTENKPALDASAERLKKELGLDVMVLNLRELFPKDGGEYLEGKEWSHASELETSEALYMFPDRVKKDRLATADNILGVNGKASTATSEKGKRLVTSLIDIIVRLTEDFMLR
jgi:creatinine amidohydrolase